MEEDRRVTQRISYNSPVRYNQKGAKIYSDTVGKDISNNGICFISNEFIPKKTHLIFEVQPPWKETPVQTLAEVVWVSNQSYSERYEIGAKFLAPL
jgi:hypothetical protein